MEKKNYIGIYFHFLYQRRKFFLKRLKNKKIKKDKIKLANLNF